MRSFAVWKTRQPDRSINKKEEEEKKNRSLDKSLARHSPFSVGKPQEKELNPSLQSSEPSGQKALVGPLPLVPTSSAGSSLSALHQAALSDFSEMLADSAEQEGRKG